MSSRLCPRDGSPLDHYPKGDVHLDRCPRCQGLWCDREELAQVLGTRDDVPNPQVALDGLRHNCPACGDPMKRCYYNHERQVVIDVCESCQGIWLDQNELSQVFCSAHGIRW